MKSFALVLALAAVMPLGTVQARDYTIDPGHTMVLARWNHFGFSNPVANFAGATGVIRYDERDASKSSVEVSIPMQQLQSFVPALDTHLKGPEFFDAEKFPTATFKSTKVSQRNGKYRIEGTLELHGVRRPVVLTATLNGMGPHAMLKVPAIGFDATTTISRSAFGITRNVPQVSDEVRLQITTEAHAAQ